MTTSRKRKFVIKFLEKDLMEAVELMRESNFFGFGTVYTGKNPRVLILYPRPDLADDVLMETLDELRDGGALTYVEESQ